MFVKHPPNWKLQKKNLVAGFEQVLTINRHSKKQADIQNPDKIIIFKKNIQKNWMSLLLVMFSLIIF